MNMDLVRKMIVKEIDTKKISGGVILAKPGTSDIAYEHSPGYRVIDIALVDADTQELIDCMFLEYPSSTNPIELIKNTIHEFGEQLTFLEDTTKYIYENWAMLNSEWLKASEEAIAEALLQEMMDNTDFGSLTIQ